MIHIKPLMPEHAKLFTDYFSNTDFGHAPHWGSCFCRFYHMTCSQEEWKNRSGEANRLEAIEEIRAGRMKGYLAFDDKKCIGWCNANALDQFPILHRDLSQMVGGDNVGCVICFVIHKDYRGQGVARLLLKEATEKFKADGFSSVIALPVDSEGAPENRYRGSLNMYRELGFVELGKRDNTVLMRLEYAETL